MNLKPSPSQTRDYKAQRASEAEAPLYIYIYIYLCIYIYIYKYIYIYMDGYIFFLSPSPVEAGLEREPSLDRYLSNVS